MSTTTEQNSKKALSAFSILMAFTILMLIGLVCMFVLPVRFEETPASNTINVSFKWPGASAAMIENEVTSKLEGTLSIVDGIEKVRSTSSNGFGFIEMDISHRHIGGKLRYEIAALIRQIFPRLPVGVSYPLTNIKAVENELQKPLVTYTMSGHLSFKEQPWPIGQLIKNKLSKLQGVDKINVYGISPRVFEIRYDLQKLSNYKISSAELSKLLGGYFKDYNLGTKIVRNEINTGHEFVYASLKPDMDAIPNWNNLPIKKTEGRTIRLSDVASVRFIEEESKTIYRLNGLNTITFDVIAKKNADHLKLANEVKKSIPGLQRNIPSGFSLMMAYDATKDMQIQLRNISLIFAVCLVLFLLVLTLIFRNVKPGLFLLTSLISNALIVSILYYLLGLQIDSFTLIASFVALSISAAHTLTNILNLRSHSKPAYSFLGGSATCICAALSTALLVNSAQTVKLIDFAWIIMTNVCVNYLVQVLFVRSLAEKYPMKREALYARSRIAQRASYYLIMSGVRFRKWVVFGYLILFGIPVFMLPVSIENEGYWGRWYASTIGSEFYTQNLRSFIDVGLGGTLRPFLTLSEKFEEKDRQASPAIHIVVNMPEGATIKQMNEVCRSFENYLAKQKGLKKFETTIANGQFAVIDILLKENALYGSYANDMQRDLELLATLTGSAEFDIRGINDAFNNKMGGEMTNLALEVLGYDYQTLMIIAAKARRLLEENPRVVDIDVQSTRSGMVPVKNSSIFRIDKPESAYSYNLTPFKIQAALKSITSNDAVIGQSYNEAEFVPVHLTSSDTEVNKWLVFHQPLIADGISNIRLNQFISTAKSGSISQIRREEQQYKLVISFNFLGKEHLGKALSDRVIREVDAEIPLGYHIRQPARSDFWGEQGEDLSWLIIVSLIILFIVCAIVLNNLLQALLVIAMVPVSIIGVFIISSVLNYPFDQGGFAALLLLSGMATSYSISIVMRYQVIRKKAVLDHREVINMMFSDNWNTVAGLLLLVLSMIPLVLFMHHEVFWYAFAMSFSGGLFFGILHIYFFLSVLILPGKLLAGQPRMPW